jgi:hypothetical protein
VFDHIGLHVMSDETNSLPSAADAELEREVREDRKYSLEEDIVRMLGPGWLSGND